MRLEEIKKRFSEMEISKEIVPIWHLDMEWLIRQAERAIDLKSERETLSMAHDDLQRENIQLRNRVQELETYVETGTYINRKLRKENKRYREALVYIASWESSPHEKYINHMKRVARQALESENHERMLHLQRK